MAEETRREHPLDEVMLAMDVVDTLRHRELLVSRELNSTEREQTLINRLRELYASQGIEVPERILAEGVEALKEDRFSYTPPAKSLQTRLALIYVERSKWQRRAGWLLLILVLVWGAYYMLVERPEQKRIEQQIEAVNSGIQHNAHSLKNLEARWQELTGRLADARLESDARFGGVSAPLIDTASQALTLAESKLEQAGDQDFSETLQRDNFSDLSSSTENRLLQQQGDLDAARNAIQQARLALEEYDLVSALPRKIESAAAAIAQIARDPEAVAQAETLRDASMSAFAAGDVDAAQAAYQSLMELRSRLASSYRLRVVSDPAAYSGVWRVPDDNPGAKNYYLIVEAISEDGSVLTLPVINEEDGKPHAVKRWGLRVDKELFERVARDKKDDGIIQMREIGRKHSGQLNPEYSIDTPGAAITEW